MISKPELISMIFIQFSLFRTSKNKQLNGAKCEKKEKNEEKLERKDSQCLFWKASNNILA